jgi:hypothetical protein
MLQFRHRAVSDKIASMASEQRPTCDHRAEPINRLVHLASESNFAKPLLIDK